MLVVSEYYICYYAMLQVSQIVTIIGVVCYLWQSLLGMVQTYPIYFSMKLQCTILDPLSCYKLHTLRIAL